ncbi:hypothetical protein TPSD3_11655 [Thioflexithrix psekupsensis]|uniref:Uncharacterized protein n=1 Tax=Thioflexithrix psekupsensis TaxID=1570016 RepID=A0A251X7U5_9GAMM|nr:hypothetical protein TPSD3_11655 [Thioflexithrix psekupsensis]
MQKKWGYLLRQIELFPDECFFIIEVSTDSSDIMQKISDHLDGIGTAFFCEDEKLSLITIDSVKKIDY